MQNTGLSPLEGVYCCSREKSALDLEATGLSANRGPGSRKVGKTHTRILESVYGKTGIEGMVPHPNWKAQSTHLILILSRRRHQGTPVSSPHR